MPAKTRIHVFSLSRVQLYRAFFPVAGNKFLSVQELPLKKTAVAGEADNVVYTAKEYNGADLNYEV